MNDRGNDRETRKLRKQITQFLNRQAHQRPERPGRERNNQDERMRRVLEEIEDLTRQLEEHQAKSLEYQDKIQEAQMIGDAEAERFYRSELRSSKEKIRLTEKHIETSQDHLEVLEEMQEADKDFHQSFNSKFTELINTFNLGQIADSLESEAIDTKDLARDIANRTGQDIDVVLEEIRKGYKTQADRYNNIFNSTEFAENLEPIIDAGVDIDEAIKMSGSITALEKTLGIEMSEMGNIVSYGTAKTVEALANNTAALKNIEGITTDETDSILQSIDDTASLYSSYFHGNEQMIEKAQEEQMRILGVLAKNDIDNQEQVTNLITDVLSNKSNTELMDEYGQAILQDDIIKNIRNGNIEEAMMDYYEAYIRDAQSGASDQYMQARYGSFHNQGLYEKARSGEITPESFAQDAYDIRTSMDNANLEDMSKVISDNLPFLEKIYNEFSTTKLGGWLEGIFQSDFMESFGGGIQSVLGGAIGSALLGEGGLLSKAGKWLKGLFGGGSGTTTATTAGTGTATASAGGAGLGVLAKAGAAIAGIGYSAVQIWEDIKGLGATWFGSDEEKADEIDRIKKDSYSGLDGIINRGIDWFVGLFGGKSLEEQLEENKPLDEDETARAIETGMTNALASDYAKAKSEYDIFNDGIRLQSGTKYVHKNGQKAILHKGEAVLTKSEADEWRENRGFTNDYDRLEANAKNSLALVDKLTDPDLLEGLWGSKEEYLSTIKRVSSTGGAGISDTGVAIGGPVDEQMMLSSTDGFFKALGPSAKEGERKYNVFAATTLAQAALESGWGKSRVAKSDKNLFGIKWTGKYAPGLTVTQGLNCPGNEQGGARPYNRYQSFGDSMTDHAWFLANNSRYAKALQASNAKDQITLIAKAGYAEDKNYASSLHKMIDKYNLNQYEQGTPFVPDTQVALLHKGEMVVPAGLNPNNLPGKKVDTSNNNEDLLNEFKQYISIFKNAVSYLAGKIESTNQNPYDAYKHTTKLRTNSQESQVRRGD